MRRTLLCSMILLVVGLLSGCHTIANQTSSSTESRDLYQKLSLNLSLNNDSFSLDERVIATLILRNETENMVIINKRMAPNDLLSIRNDNPLGEIAFIIKDPDGNMIDFAARVNMHFPREVDFAKLGSDRHIAASYELSTYYKAFEKLGKYSIQAVYHNESIIGNLDLVFIGEIFSNTVYFEIGG